MKAILLGLVLTSSFAEAQILKKIFSNNSQDGVVASWNCPQESYKSLSQLKTQAEVRVSYDESGNIKFDPDIFKVKTVSGQFLRGAVGSILSKERVAVDYSDCIEKFQQNVVKAVSDYRNKSCGTSTDGFCVATENSTEIKVKEAIAKGQYFQKNADFKKIPRILPGTDAPIDADVKDQLEKYCTGQEADTSAVITQASIQYFRSAQYENKSDFGLSCMKRIIQEINTRKADIEKEFCTTEKSFICDEVKSSSSDFYSALKPVMEFKQKQVSIFENSLYKSRFGSPEDEKLGEEYFKGKLASDTVECKDFQTSFNSSGKWVRINQLDNTLSKYVGELFNKTDPSCARTFLQNYLNDKTSMLTTDKDFAEFCFRHDTDFCRSQENKRDLILGNINQMFDHLYGKLGDRLISESLECKITEAADPLGDILNKIKDAAQSVKCIDLKEGEVKVVNAYDGQGMTNTGNYTLKKIGDNKFQAVLNMDFYNHAAQKTSPDQMMDRVRSCLKDVSPYLKGPNGEQLEILPLTTTEVAKLPASERPAPNRIGIEKPGFRSHSRMYMEDLDCPTITHEVLHLFGLCDEYKEQWLGAGKNYDCRIVPKIASVMKNQNEAFAKAVPETKSCDCSKAPCSTIMNSGDEDLKSFYLARGFFELTDYQYRNAFCNTKYLPSQTYSKLVQPGRRGLVLKNTERSVSVEHRQFDDKYPQVARSIVTCQCPTGEREQECLNGLSSIIQFADSKETVKWCPSYTNTVSTAKGDKTSNGEIELMDGTLKIVNKPEWPSLLHPSHFERILGGGCSAKGAEYSECARDAYNNGECRAPEKCKDDKVFLGIKQ